MKTTAHLLFVLLFPLCSFAQCLTGDCENGKGILIHPTGERYIGDFKNALPDGLGTYFYQNGGRYFGYWQNGLPEGAGIKNRADGKVERGVWRQGRLVKRDPQLRIEKDGQIQQFKSGCVTGNCLNGNGIFLHPDGSIYSGDFKNGDKNGVGICFYPGQMVYRGNWSNGLPDGRGTMELANGERQAGLWEKGKLKSNQSDYGRARTPAPNTLEEKCLSGNCENGYGVYQSADGRRYDGPFKDGKPHGNGIYYFPNGERYEGYMIAGELNGKGALYFPDGRIIRGYWEKGKYVQSLEVIPQNPTSPVTDEPKPTVKIWAVVIGIAAYEHMPALRFTDDDAYRFYAFLKSPEGGALPDDQIQLLIDESATRDKVIRAMKDVFGRADEDDLVVLYYSGHGLPGAFLPIDFDGLKKKLYHREVSQILASSKAKYKMCIADACHSGGLFAMRTPNAQSTLLSFYQNLAQADPGTALIMSSKSDETSLEARGLRHGVFSHFLIRGLKGEADANENKIVTVNELFNFVYRNVREYTGNLQSPVLRGNYDPDMPVGVVR